MAFFGSPLKPKPNTPGAIQQRPGAPTTMAQQPQQQPQGIFGSLSRSPQSMGPQQSMSPPPNTFGGQGAGPQASGGYSGNAGLNPNARPGSPINGQVGSPNLGYLGNYWGSSPEMQQYLQGMGIAPQYSFIGPQGSMVPDTNSPFGNNRGYVDASGQNVVGGSSGQVPYASKAQMDVNGVSATNWPSSGGGSVTGGGFQGLDTQREQSPFEKMLEGNATNLINRKPGQLEQGLEGGIMSMLNRGRYGDTQEKMLINRAQEPYAFAQREMLEDTRGDAVRRGAASSDADIRDQLNRVQAQGVQGQQRAAFDATMGLMDQRRNDLTSATGLGQGLLGQQFNQQLGAQSAGQGLLGSQLRDTQQLREMITALNALAQQQGPQGGLQFLLGGR